MAAVPFGLHAHNFHMSPSHRHTYRTLRFLTACAYSSLSRSAWVCRTSRRPGALRIFDTGTEPTGIVAVIGPIRGAGESMKGVALAANWFIGTARAAKALRVGCFQFVDVVIFSSPSYKS